MKDIISVIGCGFVGGAVRHFFSEKFDVKVYDLLEEKRNVSSIKELSNFNSEVIFLALPTPINPITGEGNFSIIELVLEELQNNENKSILVLKSSIPPGKTQFFQNKFPKLKIIFNPEFLTERNANADFQNQTKIILGGNSEYTNIVASYYQEVNPKLNIYLTSTASAEMTKFMINCFLATKISFFNEMYQVCQSLLIDYNETLSLTLLDERIGDSHTRVPGWDNHLGFGGSCFPANINIMMNKMKELNIDPKVLEAVWEKNLEVRPEKDWELLKGRAVIKE